MKLISGPTIGERKDEQERRFGRVVVCTWMRTDGDWKAYPWLFSVQEDGHDFKQNKHLWVPMEEVFNVSDYNEGDYKMFLCDRALLGKYLDRASPLLHAEDEKRKERGRDVDTKPDEDGWVTERCVGSDGDEYVVRSKTHSEFKAPGMEDGDEDC